MTDVIKPVPGRLGRLHAPDPRDRKFALRPVSVPVERSQKYWLSLGVPLDQGATSQCVAYATTKYLTTHPIVNKPHLSPAELYRECQRNDEWDGEEPDYEGTSVRAAMKVLKRDGLVSEYRWAWDVETVVTHLLMVGPMVLGINWYRQMFFPDTQGFIWPDGPLDGGHAILAIGANRRKACPDGKIGAIRLLNSWGPTYGSNGRVWMSFQVLGRLLAEDGEAALATEIKRKVA